MFGVLQWFCLSVTETALIWVRPWSFFSIFIVSVAIWHDSTTGLEIQAREYSISLATFSLIGKKVWTRSLWLLMSPKNQPVPFFFLTFFDGIALRGWKILITSASEENNFKLGASREIYGDMDWQNWKRSSELHLGQPLKLPKRSTSIFSLQFQCIIQVMTIGKLIRQVLL